MSSHREAPEISKDPVADSTDLYAFVSPDDPSTVTIIANYVPLQQPAGGPNFYEFGDDVLYEIHIDNDNDADADITYQFRFNTVLTDTGPNDIFLYNTGQIMHISDVTWNRKQFYSVTRLDRHGSRVLATNLPCPPCNVGKNSIPSYAPLTAEAIQPLGSGGKVFAGQRADGFYVDLGSVFDLGDLRPFQADFLIKGTAMPGINTLAGLNVHSIAIQVPISQLTSDGTLPTNYQAGDSTIGIWTTASRQKGSIGGYGGFSAGPWAQLSRLGMPLINEVIIAMGQKDYWNSQEPKKDAQFSRFYDHPSLASLLNTLYPGAFPNIAAYTAMASTTRPDLDAVLLTGVPAGLFAGFRCHKGRLAPFERGDPPYYLGLVGQPFGRHRWRQCWVPQRSSCRRRRCQRRAESRGRGTAPRCCLKLHARRQWGGRLALRRRWHRTDNDRRSGRCRPQL